MRAVYTKESGRYIQKNQLLFLPQTMREDTNVL